MRKTLKKTIKKLLFVSVLVALLLTSRISVYANVLQWRSTDQNGNNYWLSCGSSADNYFFVCDSNNVCTDLGSDGATQACRDEGFIQ